MDRTIRKELQPGVLLTIVSTDKFKTSCIGVNFLCGLNMEKASFLAMIPSVLLRGCEKYEDMRKLNRELDSLYGARIEPYIRKKGETECVGFVADAIEDRFVGEDGILKRTVGLISDIIFSPLMENGAFRKDYVESEKENLIDKINARINDKRFYAVKRLWEIMCEDEAFGISELGDEESVRNITAESLTLEYRKMIEECGLSLFYCGGEDPDKVEEIFKGAFSNAGKKKMRLFEETLPKMPEEVKNAEEVLNISQAKLAMGFRTGTTIRDKDYPALMVMNAIFGAGTTSKLFINVRERLSLCYYASSSIESVKGIMTVSSGIDARNFDAAKNEILSQLDEIKKGNISEEEWDAAIKTLSGAVRSIQDSQYRLEDFWLLRTVAKEGDGPEDLLEKIQKVQKADVMKAAERLALDTIYFLKGAEEAAQ